MNNQHSFFQGFIPQQERMGQHSNLPNALIFNLMILELSNNWDGVKRVVERLHGQDKIKVDAMENDWLQFLKSNNLDISTFNNENDFIDANFKTLN